VRRREPCCALSCVTYPPANPEPEALRRIQAPTLILHGDRDWLFPVEVPLALYRLLPDAELCVLPQTGHGVHAERPEWFQAIVVDFLARRAA
jgi:pimeloyl-ACP methyl ester carboxylesterase